MHRGKQGFVQKLAVHPAQMHDTHRETVFLEMLLIKNTFATYSKCSQAFRIGIGKNQLAAADIGEHAQAVVFPQP